MVEPDATPFMVKFDAADTGKKGKIGLAAFTPLIDELIGSQDPKKAELYFRSLDIDGSNEVSREEFEEFVKATLRNDDKYIIKLVFRDFDKDRSSILRLSEIKEIGEFVGRPLHDATIKAKIKEITGKEGSALTFAQLVKLLTGEIIKEDTDPYDGKLKKS
jgi:Ca2+-binding EF-hand superfamily protein